MSLNRSLALKLQLNQDIRKVSTPPSTLAALTEIMRGLFGPGEYKVKYQDEEKDWVTVATDQDLLFAYNSAAGPSLKLEITKEPAKLASGHPAAKAGHRKEGKFISFMHQLIRLEVSSALGMSVPVFHPGVTCDGCKAHPLPGIRYQCTICDNLDYCEVCEATIDHPHPFLKITDPSQSLPEVRVSLEAVYPCKAFKNFSRLVKTPKPKMVFLRHESFPDDSEVTSGATVTKIWVVRNPGPLAWPIGVGIKSTKGDVYSEVCAVSSLQPGEEGLVACTVSVPKKKGVIKGTFRLVLPDNRKFGDKLHMKVTTSVDYQYQLGQLLSMGFPDSEELHALLEASEGDINKVLAHLEPSNHSPNS